MTTREAAKVIGVSSTHVRHLIRTGVLKAKKRLDEWNQPYYNITPAAARSCRDHRPKVGHKSKGAK